MRNFIDWLAVAAVRDAYLSGALAFVLSADMRRILWLNGEAARSFGYALVGDALGQPSGFDRATLRQLDHGKKSGRMIQLRGREGRRNFLVTLLKGDGLKGDGDNALLVKSVVDQHHQTSSDLLQNLVGDEGNAALLLGDGAVLDADKAFPLSPQSLAPHLQALEIGQSYKGRLHDGETAFYCGIARLDDTRFLIISEQEQADNIISHNPPSTMLNDDERMAFREIAERLKQDITSGHGLLPIPDHALDEGDALPFTELNLDDLEELLDLTTSGVIFLDQDLKISALTPSTNALFDVPPHQVIGELLSSFLSAQSAGQFLTYRADADRHAFLNKGCVLAFKNGNKAPREFAMTLIKLRSGCGYAALLHPRDSTKLRGKNQDSTQKIETGTLLPKSSDDLSFLAQTVHEIRTPLNAILGFAELMRDEKFGPIDNQRYREYLRDMVQSGQHVLSLVNDLLAQARQKDDPQKPLLNQAPKPNLMDNVKLGAALREAAHLLQEQANRDGIILRISLEPQLPDIHADERAVRQIILNILSNAIRFTPTGGQIVLSAARTEEHQVLLRIRDTGIGMSEEEMARAMRPYGQIAQKHPRHDDGAYIGTGLGLPLTKALVEDNGGQFKITSQSGVGTIVEITFQMAS